MEKPPFLFDGFSFDFPFDYPFSPPKVTFMTNDGQTRFNPNLYQINGNGKVCLSILNTWSESTWSQVQLFSSVIETIAAKFIASE
jgi:ubiquitin-protein ligase